jgi:superfamily II DNA/RNA helicase
LTFQTLGIDQDIVDALANKGITEPFPIQEQAIPVALSGQDIIGQAKTGTGKTFGFGLPLIQRLGTNPTKGAKALVVVPTRELAQQVYEDLVLATSNRETEVAVIIGGKAQDQQIKDIDSGAQIIVGTPGRLIDLNNQRKLNLADIQIMVLDEADEMLDLGFLPDIEKLFTKTPAERQTLLFSATMPGPIVNLARKYQNRAVHIRVNDPDEGHTKADIKQFVYRTHSLDKDEMVGRILQSPGRGKTVIFVKTKRTAAKLGEELVDRGFNATALHGDMNQEARERSMKAFREGKKEILVATEVAARGIDVDDVTHVINYSCPEDEKAYLHRTGRTGRAGRTGIAITFVDWEDLTRWQNINKELQLDYHEPVETYSSSKNLFEDLAIAEGTKGRLKPASPKANTDKPGGHSQGNHQRSDRNKTRGGDKPHKTGTEHHTKDAHEKTPETTHADHEHRTPNSERNRQRRRTRGGN